jgi:succinoglycan biosynthesis transport protein ExoP
MGAIYDAMRKAEAERRARNAGMPTPEPAVVVDVRHALPDGPTGEDEPPRPAARPNGHAQARPGAPVPPRRSPLVAVSDPSGVAAEQLRAVRSRLLALMKERGDRTVVVTSPGRGEGKSLTACNLALLCADGARRVLLVDADLRKPTVADLVGVPRVPGLSDVLLGRASREEAVVRLGWSALDVLAAGGSVQAPAEILDGAAARALFASLREAYDLVIVDCPPALPVTDAAILGAQTDAVVLVARVGQTPRDALAEAAETLSKSNLLGVVVNGVAERPFAKRRYYEY